MYDEGATVSVVVDAGAHGSHVVRLRAAVLLCLLTTSLCIPWRTHTYTHSRPHAHRFSPTLATLNSWSDRMFVQAGIVAAHFPDDPDANGVAPGVLRNK